MRRAWIAAACLGVGALIGIAFRAGAVRCGGHNTLSAWASLRGLAGSQAAFQERGAIDVDGDGRGEFGFLAELSGAVALPRSDSALQPPVISGAYRIVRPDGTASRSGYRFRLFLPDAQGHGVRETGTPPLPPREPGSG